MQNPNVTRILTHLFFITEIHASDGCFRRYLNPEKVESKSFTRLRRTLCPNPISEYADGFLNEIIVNPRYGKVKEFLLASG